MHGADERFDILQIALGLDRLLDVLCAVPLHAVADLGVVDDPAFLQRCNNARINVQRYAVHLTQVAQDGLIVRGGRIFPQCPDAPDAVAAEIAVKFKFDQRWRDHVQKRFQLFRFRIGALFFLKKCHAHPSRNR